jgi:UDP-glucose 4-epimerase
LALKAEATDANYNIASGTETSLNELAKLILQLTGSSLQPIHKKDANPGVQKRKAGVERAKTDLGFEAAIPLEEGLNKLITWRMKARAQGT